MLRAFLLGFCLGHGWLDELFFGYLGFLRDWSGWVMLPFQAQWRTFAEGDAALFVHVH